jgi:hypothetical protein
MHGRFVSYINLSRALTVMPGQLFRHFCPYRANPIDPAPKCSLCSCTPMSGAPAAIARSPLSPPCCPMPRQPALCCLLTGRRRRRPYAEQRVRRGVVTVVKSPRKFLYGRVGPPRLDMGNLPLRGSPWTSSTPRRPDSRHLFLARALGSYR